jgi:hypothetical protein
MLRIVPSTIPINGTEKLLHITFSFSTIEINGRVLFSEFFITWVVGGKPQEIMPPEFEKAQSYEMMIN